MKTTGNIFVLILTLALIFTALPARLAFADGGFTPPWLPDYAYDDNELYLAGEVLAPADSLPQAQEIAAAYGLELKSYSYGIAVLAAPDAKEAVAQSLAAQTETAPAGGVILPQLSFNWLYYTDETIAKRSGSQSGNAYNFILNSIAGYVGADLPKTPLKTSGALDLSEQWQHKTIDSERAWSISQGENVLIAVIDSGIDIDHPAFAGRISDKSFNAITEQIGLAYVRDDDGYSHGTHVSGIAAGALSTLNSGHNVSGVAPQAKILAIKADTNLYANLYMASVLRGINYAAENGAKVINMSLLRAYSGGPDALEQTVISGAVARGVTIVCAAGNGRENHAGYPAAYAETIAVSALNYREQFEYGFSNWGPEIDVVAPGNGVYSTVRGGGYWYGGGTSMATPCVAGVAALIIAQHPEYTPQQVKDIICQTARPAGGLGRDDYYGWGILNAYGAVLGPQALYNVTFDYDDGRAPLSVKATPGSQLLAPFDPEREGYAFNGWYIAGTNNLYNFADTIAGPLNLYAKWIAPQAGMYLREFPDKNFRRAILSLLNEDGANRVDGSYLENDRSTLAAITVLEIYNRGIEDLSGLVYLPNLQTLNCENNQLSSLDLTNNTALLAVYCRTNQLTNIDLSQNSKLKLLNCSNNKLVALDTTSCEALENLWCVGNLLVSLDMQKNSALEILHCYWNQLISLTVPGNAALTSLDCAYNRLTTLDVSQCSGLTGFGCVSNQLTSLDVSGCPALEWLGCWDNNLYTLNVTGCTNLQYLNCWYNNLTTLDISDSTALEYLICGYNYLRSVDDVVGWQKTGLALGDTFEFHPQKEISGKSRHGVILYHNSARPAIIKLYNKYNNIVYSAATAPDGTYTLYAPADTGYKLVVSKRGYLSYTIKNITLAEDGGLDTLDLRQMAGDIDGNGVVNAEDLAILLSEFNRVPQVDQRADIDGNGLVNATDLAYLLAGFNKRDIEMEAGD